VLERKNHSAPDAPKLSTSLTGFFVGAKKKRTLHYRGAFFFSVIPFLFSLRQLRRLSSVFSTLAQRLQYLMCISCRHYRILTGEDL
jgi:hypothetical protein